MANFFETFNNACLFKQEVILIRVDDFRSI